NTAKDPHGFIAQTIHNGKCERERVSVELCIKFDGSDIRLSDAIVKGRFPPVFLSMVIGGLVVQTCHQASGAIGDFDGAGCGTGNDRNGKSWVKVGSTHMALEIFDNGTLSNCGNH